MLEARVCQYANTPDGHFVIDRHPGRKDVWLVGGGSGHGFKLGPVVGEYVARCVVADGEVDPFFSLTRFAMS
jgi:glycine/D-amino acid oxidase-like deaminating enzyme